MKYEGERLDPWDEEREEAPIGNLDNSYRP